MQHYPLESPIDGVVCRASTNATRPVAFLSQPVPPVVASFRSLVLSVPVLSTPRAGAPGRVWLGSGERVCGISSQTDYLGGPKDEKRHGYIQALEYKYLLLFFFLHPGLVLFVASTLRFWRHLYLLVFTSCRGYEPADTHNRVT